MKSQIRPRYEVFRFSNADILLLDTVGAVALVPSLNNRTALALVSIQIRTNIVVAYTNIDATNPYMALIDDYTLDGIYFEDFHGTSVFSNLFAGTGLNLSQSNGEELTVPATTAFVDPRWVANFADYADLFANGGIFLLFGNGGSDLTGGDAANYMDVYVEYKIVNLLN